MGHLQATGIDAAGRKQYLYHPSWREHRDRQKFERMLRFGTQLPHLRRRLVKELAGDGAHPQRVLAGAVRLLDVGVFRIGSEEYAEEDGGLGLATLHQEHVIVHDGLDRVRLPGQVRHRSGVQVIDDPPSYDLIRALQPPPRRRAELLAYRQGRRWHDVSSDDINEYLKRSWATTSAPRTSAPGTRRCWPRSRSPPRGARPPPRRPASARSTSPCAGSRSCWATRPAVARRAYIDPRVFDRYLVGLDDRRRADRIRDLGAVNDRIRARMERAVLALLDRGPRTRAALEQSEAIAA